MNTAMATSLLDLLDKVPADARLSYEHSPTHHQMIPVGGLASAAAFRIRELEAERDALRAAAERYRWARDILGGDDSAAGDRKAAQLAHGLMLQLSLDAAIDAAIAREDVV